MKRNYCGIDVNLRTVYEGRRTSKIQQQNNEKQGWPRLSGEDDKVNHKRRPFYYEFREFKQTRTAPPTRTSPKSRTTAMHACSTSLYFS